VVIDCRVDLLTNVCQRRFDVGAGQRVF
jgi:hypothetical protein